MFPKVKWARFGVYVGEENRLFVTSGAYNNDEKIIYLNTVEFVKPRDIYLIYIIFHELIHHIFNVLDLPMSIDHIHDSIDAFKDRKFVNKIYNGKTKFVLLDNRKIYKVED